MAQVPIETRLAVYGLDAAKLQLTDLQVEAGQELVLTNDDHHATNQFVTLTPKTINDVKSWIGTPDSAFAHPITPVTRPATVIPALQEFTAVQHTDLHSLSQSFVLGHSDTIAASQIPALNAWLVSINPQIFLFHYQDITVKAGATLTLASAVHVLFARNVTIEHTGRVVVKANHCKVDAARITGE
jgi:hypothetical protein